jgi:flagellar biosynthesis/type III secretory pathway chaperone
MGDWVEELCKLFQKEVGLYNELYQIELEKREFIHKADGRGLQESVNRTYHLMVEASELERVRMKSIEEVYKTREITPSESGITLSDFLNKMDRESNFRLKTFATELKTVVHKLKEAILLNDKLIQTRQEILKTTITEMQKLDGDKTYQPAGAKETTKSSSGKSRALVLNTSA